ncbi:hypothetical protein NE626_05735 [Intestinimonas massiliensis]|uniref:Uncharacterized protein n=1 Tax=Intestinimonas massiliensis (ex Afouda et al. 2020) TaxID=1673721 RepID=A0ABS9M8Y2_9FIRM|nr:hypothetical protein [Intestinimonas massiliensis (ex Afouda et al. 2020)]MCG4527269.1 hypothetical protein [Intestinimonas massiliensis (ex Afouda et al. 2020)]MCQ4806326.1 hypothetical protein [Intestinimonas massiliensis (ex Afouda et al. 2020)]
MARGKRELPRRRSGKVTLGLLALVLCCAVGGTLAWLIDATNPLENTFTPAQVKCTVVEDAFDGSTKTNVSVQNPADEKNVTAYIRVALVPTWEDENGNAVAEPASLDDLTLSLNPTDWVKIDSYYYCKTPVEPGSSTPVLVNSATVKTDNGYSMNLQILAEAVQAEPASAVESVWPVSVGSGGTLSGK